MGDIEASAKLQCIRVLFSSYSACHLCSSMANHGTTELHGQHCYNRISFAISNRYHQLVKMNVHDMNEHPNIM